MTEETATALAKRILDLSQAGEISVSIHSSSGMNLRFANNDITTNGVIENLGINVTASFGKRSASVSVTQADDDTLLEAVARAESLARLAPENPEHMPLPGPATFDAPIDYSDATALAGPSELASWIRPVIEASREEGVNSAGYLSREVHRGCIANSAGLTIFQESTTADFSMTARTGEGGGSGWASTQVTDTGGLDLLPVGARAIRKALESRNPAPHPPGRTTVILEPAAVRDLISLLVFQLDRRSFDEKRSFLGELTGKDDPIGERLFGDRATISSNPLYDLAPCATHSEGLPLESLPWIEDGILRNLHVSRFWAGKSGIRPLPGPRNLIMAGEGSSLDELIARVDDGILITRLWYIRMVRPQSLLFTGLTRDGTFRIEKGKITGPVNNFRFNETPANVLKNLIATGLPARVLGSEGDMPMHVPPCIVGDFNLSSVSDAS